MLTRRYVFAVTGPCDYFTVESFRATTDWLDSSDNHNMHACWNKFEDFVQKLQAEHCSQSDSSLLATQFSDDSWEVSVFSTILLEFSEMFFSCPYQSPGDVLKQGVLLSAAAPPLNPQCRG